VCFQDYKAAEKASTIGKSGTQKSVHHSYVNVPNTASVHESPSDNRPQHKSPEQEPGSPANNKLASSDDKQQSGKSPNNPSSAGEPRRSEVITSTAPVRPPPPVNKSQVPLHNANVQQPSRGWH